jgi:DNA-binding NtrC family response regulator
MNDQQKTILIIDDEPEIRNLMEEILSEEGYKTLSAESAQKAEHIISTHQVDLVYLDIWMPGTDGVDLLKKWTKTNNLKAPIIMISGHATIKTAVETTRLGAFDLIEKPLSIEKLLTSAEKALKSRNEGGLDNEIISFLKKQTNAYSDSFARLDSIVDKNNIVCLEGEAGTEKESFGKYLHYQQYNQKNNFVSVPLNLLLSEQQESITAINELTKTFDRLEEGTVYLSGFINLSIENQTNVQNFLNNWLPKQRNICVLEMPKTKIKTPTSEDGTTLKQILSDIVIIDLPPLRQHLQDVPDLLNIFVNYFVTVEGLSQRRFSLAAMNMLTKYAWPGNLKQLKNMVHTILIRSNKEIINIEEVEETLILQGPSGNLLVQNDMMSMTMTEARKEFEKAFLLRQLELVGWKVAELARRVDMERTNLYRKLSSLGIEYKNKKQ